MLPVGLTGALAGCGGGSIVPAQLASIAVGPSDITLAKGLKQQYTATGIYSDGSRQELTSVAWSSAAPTIASVTGITNGDALATALGIPGTTTITATVGGLTGTTALTVTAAALASIGVTPVNVSIPVGLTDQFTATGTYTDNSIQDITTKVTWRSTAPTVVSIGNAPGNIGLARAAAVGTATITATSHGLSGATPLTVNSAVLVSVGVTPANLKIAVGLTHQFTATGVYSDDSTHDLTASVVWTTSAAAVAPISDANGFKGLATALAPGSATFTAALGAVSATAAITVSPATLVSIGVTPAGAVIADGTDQQFVATGTFSDNSTQDLTRFATWSSSASTVATISNAPGSNGLATSIGPGSAKIAAAYGGVSGSTPFTVNTKRLVSIALTPLSPRIANGTTQQFEATGTFSDRSIQNLTAAVAWSSSDAGVATVSNAPRFNGFASALRRGSATITAALHDVSGSTTLTVTPATLVTLTVRPADPSIPDGTQQQFVATGTYSDGSTQDLTASVAWSSSASTTASVSNARFKGRADALKPGSAVIGATFAGVSGSTRLTVTSATLVSIAVTPLSAVIGRGTERQFVALGTYTDNSTQNLTATVTWNSSGPAVAAVSNAAGSRGLAAALAVGSASISAAAGNIESSGVPLTVIAAQEYAYVANSGDNTVSQYLAGAGGALAAINPATVAAGVFPESLAVDPTSRYVYVANAVDSSVSQFTIGTGGALTAIRPAVAAGAYPQSVTVDPSGRYVYVANNADNTVSQYNIGAGGALTAMSPPTVMAGNAPQSVAVDPTGRYAYVVNNGGGDVSQFRIGIGGVLAAMNPASVAAGVFPESLAVDPTGRYVYVANFVDNTVAEFTIGDGGGLVAMSPPTVGTDSGPEAITIDPSGRHVYVANVTAGTVSQFSIGAAGALSPMVPASVQAGGDPQSVTVDLSGHYLFVANEDTGMAVQFIIGPNGALPTTSSGTIATGSGPASIATAY